MNNIQEKKWLTVDEAFIQCSQKDLNRTKKTIRQWCRQEHVESQKRVTPNGEAWMIAGDSLKVKIASELEFAASRTPSAERAHTGTYQSEPVQASTDPFIQVRDGTTPNEPGLAAIAREEIQGLRDVVRSLEIDKGIRDAQIKYLEKENEKGREALSGQSRYIGHLETLAQLNGASPDAKFLASPVPNIESGTDLPSGEIPNPMQQNLGYNLPHGSTR